MTRLKGWHLICIYIGIEACLNISARSFHLYNVWFFLKAHASPGWLAWILTASWAANTAVLPFAGAIAERLPKARLVFAASVASTFAAAFALVLTVDGRAGELTEMLTYLACAVVLSLCAGAVAPLALALLPALGARQEDVNRGLRVRSSMFIVNLVLGPTLAGAAIGEFGGESALVLQVIASCSGLALAVIFVRAVPRGIQDAGGLPAQSVLRDIRWGFRRVLEIPSERAIATVSLFANLFYVPFVSLLIPAKVIGLGYSMFDLALVELSMGFGVLLATTYGMPAMGPRLSQHQLASSGAASLGVAMIGFSLVSQLALLCALTALAGAGLSTFNVTVNTRRAMSIPDGFRSAMESSLLFFCTLAVPVGLTLSREALLRISPSAVIGSAGVAFCAAITIIFFSSSLRQMLNSTEAGSYYGRLYSHLFVR